MFADGNFLRLPDDLFEDLHWGSLDEFVDSLPKDALREQLVQAIRGKGAFRRFKDIVFGGGNVALKHQWLWFETRRKRKRIVQWLRDDLQIVRLDKKTIAEPPVVLWPEIVMHADVPQDVRELLVSRLE